MRVHNNHLAAILKTTYGAEYHIGFTVYPQAYYYSCWQEYMCIYTKAKKRDFFLYVLRNSGMNIPKLDTKPVHKVISIGMNILCQGISPKKIEKLFLKAYKQECLT